MRIGDLKTGDRIRVRWYPGHAGLVGVVLMVVPHASRASGTHIRTDGGQCVRIKASMRIELVQ